MCDAGRRVQLETPEPASGGIDVQGLTLGAQGQTINLIDIASVSRGRVDQPDQIIRHNGVEAFTLGIAGLASENIVSVGERIDARLAELAEVLRAGVTIEPIYEQHRVVEQANSEFLVSLAVSVGVVIAVLAVFMGWRAAIVVGLTLLLTVTSTFFFMNTPIFYISYKAAQGTEIAQTVADLQKIEAWLLKRDDVIATTTTSGRPFSRFILTYTPAKPDASYGQILVRAASFAAIPALREDLSAFGAAQLPWAETRVEQISYGPPVTADVEVRLSGPDPDVLRALGDEALAILDSSALLHTQRVDWREREFATRPLYAADRAQSLGVTRTDVATALALATDGLIAGNGLLCLHGGDHHGRSWFCNISDADRSARALSHISPLRTTCRKAKCSKGCCGSGPECNGLAASASGGRVGSFTVR